MLNPEAKILDYGCGSGNVVVAGREKGFDIYGADVFYDGANSRKNVEKLNLLGNVIREIKQGKIDFTDNTFDLVLSNQVFEHVEDLESVLIEIHRVMKKDAVLLCLFPSKDVIREGHIGIPFAHWLPKNSNLRYYYALTLREIGFGYFKGSKSKTQWTTDALNWIDKYTIYREKHEIFQIFSRYFEFKMIEEDCIEYRLSASPQKKLLSKLLKFPLLTEISRILFQKLAGMVIIAKKKEPSKARRSVIA
ncbi:MAG: class I SAM-dependent methyltransferase [Symploca sp. SIO3C6]|nr:class I SAM-dependent methyltransferase [Symploca sp. SIO3C6]